VQLCPKCGDSAALTRRQINKTLVKYSYPAFAGMCGIVVADLFYPMLDRDRFLIAGVCLFLAPGLFHVVSSARKRLAIDVRNIRHAYLSGGAVSIFLAILMAGNGGLDNSPSTAMRTTVLSEQAVRGKSGTNYTVKVRSWRPGRATEQLGVNGRTYRSVSTGKGVEVEMHRGFFGLPWYSGVYWEGDRTTGLGRLSNLRQGWGAVCGAALRIGGIRAGYFRCQSPNNEFLEDIGGGSCANADQSVFKS
jgi:hypothetical protein